MDVGFAESSSTNIVTRDPHPRPLLPEARRCVDPIMWAAASSGIWIAARSLPSKNKIITAATAMYY